MAIGVIVPAVKDGGDRPVLGFVTAAFERRGMLAGRVRWDSPADDQELVWVVEAQVAATLDRIAVRHPDQTPVIVAESVGTVAVAPLAAARRLAAIWVTPMMKVASVADAIGRNPAPTLVIGGAADPWWDGDRARATGKPVFEVPGADHALFVSGPLRESARALGDVATAIEDYLDRLPRATR